MNRILDIQCHVRRQREYGESNFVLIRALKEKEYFYGWYNDIIEEINAIRDDDAEVESRKMKLFLTAMLPPVCLSGIPDLRWAT